VTGTGPGGELSETGSTEPRNGSPRVLVAEDHDDMRQLTVRMLAKLGCTDVDEVCDGQEAVEALAAQRYDLLLLDLSMPRLSGLEVIRWLDAHPDRLDGLTIAVLSASAHDERPTLNELGVRFVISKPVRLHHLAELVDAVRAG
jgi:CheY-like chemotaxis protein